MQNSKSKKQEVSDEEQLELLIEETRAIFSETVFSSRMTSVEGKHQVGQTIAENPLYKKWGKQSGELIKRIATALERSEADIYLCVQFYQKYPDVSTVVESLKGKKNDLTWAAVRRLLSGKEEIGEHKHEWEKITAWRCKVEGCEKITAKEPE